VGREPSSRSAEREPDGEVALARGVPREHEVRHVRGRDEEDERDRRQQQAQRGPETGGRRVGKGGDDRLERAVFAALDGQRLPERAQLGARLSIGHARLQSRDEAHAPATPEAQPRRDAAPLRLAHRRPYVDVIAREAEVGRRHADDGVPLVPQRDRPADRIGLAVEEAQPEAVADHGDGRQVVVRPEPSAGGGPPPQRAEERLGHQRIGYGLDDVAGVEGARDLGMARQRRQRLRGLPVGNVRCGEGLSSLLSGKAARAVDEDERCGLVVGQRPLQDAVDDAEDRRRGADAETERERRQSREARASGEGAERVAEVRHGAMLRLPPAAAAALRAPAAERERWPRERRAVRLRPNRRTP
jgi:hypothetical protein